MPVGAARCTHLFTFSQGHHPCVDGGLGPPMAFGGGGWLVGWLIGCKTRLWRPAAAPQSGTSPSRPMPRPWMSVCVPLLPPDRSPHCGSSMIFQAPILGSTPLPHLGTLPAPLALPAGKGDHLVLGYQPGPTPLHPATSRTQKAARCNSNGSRMARSGSAAATPRLLVPGIETK